MPAAPLSGDPPRATDGAAPGADRLLERIWADAAGRGASDVHFEPGSSGGRVRFRVQGLLESGPELAGPAYAAALAALKRAAGLSLAVRRQIQDGRLAVAVGERRWEVRVGLLPAWHGEAAVARWLPRTEETADLEGLGLEPGPAARLRAWLEAGDGLVVAAGPTGSGKTTTLHAALRHLRGPGRKIVTVEDPVEYRLDGLLQIAVRPTLGLTFARALRAVLRHAPEVLLIGELRDRETAAIGLQAALTGHLVLTSVHARDAPAALPRLQGLGLAAPLLATVLRGVLAQRLLRVLCPACRARGPVDPVLWSSCPEGLRPKDGWTGRKTGCPACRGSGYGGRRGVFEVLSGGPELARALRRGAADREMRDLARRLGWVPLETTAWGLAASGETTAEEVLRVCATGESEPATLPEEADS